MTSVSGTLIARINDGAHDKCDGLATTWINEPISYETGSLLPHLHFTHSPNQNEQRIANGAF